MHEVGLRIAGHLADAEPRERIKPVARQQPGRWLEAAVAEEQDGHGGGMGAHDGGIVDHLGLSDFSSPNRGHFIGSFPL
ncbi:hypothetical protein DVW87_01385 [Sphingomonas aracearum]|uniref:Uncharacterized protein n=1 Tax=Sphingomonas aracearum TaxID=2283317 RepID=A0A369VXQ4_9SPHN|nr:hypothetical protein DVW87_01385 [Sphingomonas aracearum]